MSGGNARTITGTVIFEGNGLAGVKITDKVNVYTQTDSNGNFSFSTKKRQLSIYPQKKGYLFTPSIVEVQDENKIDFIAQKAEKLNGELVLEKILIIPTSIVSFVDNNFEYEYQNETCLKIDKINININESIITNQQKYFAPIKKETDILGENSYSYMVENGKTEIKITYTLSTFFKSNNRENIANETPKIIRVNTVLDTGNLIDGYYELFTNSINSSYNGFSYNISFVFKFNKS